LEDLVAKAKNGVIVPSEEDVKKVIAKLRREMKGNPRRFAAFKRNPRAMLGALGLNEDVQAELIREMGLATALPCIFTNCHITCIFTKCISTRLILMKDE
jgi:hypothetical protein